jgi:predicted RNA-binding protein with PUA-like domain
MALWLLKTEPSEYSFADLLRDKRTTWDGVSNALAVKHLRAMKNGDEALIYHTGDERSVIGIAEVVRVGGDDKTPIVEIKPRRALKRPVGLSEIRNDQSFQGWELLRLPRLSVMPVSREIWKRLIELSERSAP